jgi:hypothetical protein
MAHAPAAEAPAMITISCRLVTQGRMPSLVEHHRRPSESLLCAVAFLVLLLCRDIDFCLLIGVGPHLLHMR